LVGGSFGYFGQEYEDLDAQNTVLDEILAESQLTLEEARTALGTMLFSGDDVFKRVGDLSGGEMGRLAFLKLLLSGANLLILDEPTNHLDIESCQMVEKMLQDYEGTILLVSHDRYFIDQIANRLLSLNEGKLESYCGNYSYYQEKLLAQQKLDTFTQRETRQDRLRPEILAREQEKERQKIRRKRIRDLETIENHIMDLESRKTELEIQLSDPLTYSDEEKARASTTSYKNIEEILALAYRDWEILNQKLEDEQIEGCNDEISAH